MKWKYLGAVCGALSLYWCSASNLPGSKRVFPSMDYKLSPMPDGRTRVIFHISHNSGGASGCLPFLGFTLDSSQNWYKVVAWYDMRDAQNSGSCERYDTIYYQGIRADSVQLVTATIYRDSMEYSFSQMNWNPADSFYFFSGKAGGILPGSHLLRVRTNARLKNLRIENPAQIPLKGIEVLTTSGRVLQRESGKAKVVSTQKLPAGFYFVRLISDYGNQVEIAIIN